MAKRYWATGFLMAALLMLAACGQPVPAPTPATAAPAPTKAAAAPAQPSAAPTAAAPAPTKAAAPAASSSTVDFPAKGRAITIMVPYPAGGNVDLSARLVAPGLEKALGTPVEIVNKPGAAAQVATTELVKAKPDGHTLLWVSGTAIMSTYLDHEKQAIYHRKDLVTVAHTHWTPVGIAVKAGGKYKAFDDVIKAAKANPDTVKVGDSGLMGTPHMAMVLLEGASGAKFAPVHFDGGPPATTALLGDHIDCQAEGTSAFVSAYKGGNLKVVGLFDTNPSKTFPEAELIPSKGYNVLFGLSLGLVAPGGTPKEIVSKLDNAIKSATEPAEFVKKSEELGFDVRYMNSDKYAELWTDLEKGVASVIKSVRGQVREK